MILGFIRFQLPTLRILTGRTKKTGLNWTKVVFFLIGTQAGS
jgi:hypothetical protein